MNQYELYLNAVMQNGLSIKYIPKKKLNNRICRLAIKQNGLALKYIPQNYINPIICRIALEQNSMALEYVPNHWKDYELCNNAVSNNGLALQFIPIYKRDLKICYSAIEQNGLALKYVPTHKKILNVCNIAILQNGLALQYVPYNKRLKILVDNAILQNGLAIAYINPNILRFHKRLYNAFLLNRSIFEFPKLQQLVSKYLPDNNILKIDGTCLKYYTSYMNLTNSILIAVKNNSSVLGFISDIKKSHQVLMEMNDIPNPNFKYEWIPPNLFNNEIYLKIVKINGILIEKIPFEYITDQMCTIAIENKTPLKYIPEIFRSLDLCLKALIYDESAIKYIPHEFMNMQICNLAVDYNINAIIYIPYIIFSLEIYKLIVLKNSDLLQYIPKHFIVPELFLQNFDMKYSKLLYNMYNICNEMITSEICKNAILESAENIQFVPDKYKSIELIILIIKKYGLIKYCPIDMLNYELCKIAVTKNYIVIYDVPEHLIDIELWKLAILNDYTGNVYLNCPDKYKTYELNLIAVKQNGNLIKNILKNNNNNNIIII